MKGTSDYVYLDLWGSSLTPSNSKARYFMIILDVHFRKLWVWTQNTKDKIFNNYKKLEASGEESNHKTMERFKIDKSFRFCS